MRFGNDEVGLSQYVSCLSEDFERFFGARLDAAIVALDELSSSTENKSRSRNVSPKAPLYAEELFPNWKGGLLD